MNSCLEDIVTLGTCDEDISSSGLTLLQAGGMSLKNLENIASDAYIQGVRLAGNKKKLAINLLRNDFIGAIQAHNVNANITEVVYNTSSFKANTDMGLYAGERGVYLHATPSYRGHLRKIIIKSVQCYPLVSRAGEIIIVDVIDGIPMEVPYPVNFIAGQINTFPINYTAQDKNVKILIDNTDVNLLSAPLQCMKGCHESMPNPCAWADGWDGTKQVKSEGYGINVQFYCHCDYDTLLCQLSKGYIGELLWLKWQELVYDEQLKTNRFSTWVIYNRDDIKDHYLPDIQNQYNSKWNQFVSGLYNILKNLKDDCLDCRGIRKITNL